MKLARHRNHWWGFGCRFAYGRGDFLQVVVRLLCWQWWFEWDLSKKVERFAVKYLSEDDTLYVDSVGYVPAIRSEAYDEDSGVIVCRGSKGEVGCIRIAGASRMKSAGWRCLYEHGGSKLVSKVMAVLFPPRSFRKEGGAKAQIDM